METLLIAIVVFFGIVVVLAIIAWRIKCKAEDELDRESDTYFDIECANCIDTNCSLCGRK